MNYKEFIELLNTDEYKQETYRKETYNEFEALWDYGNIATLYSKLKSENGAIPSQREFIEKGLKNAKKFFTEQDTHYIFKTKQNYTFEWNERLITAVKARLARTYSSMLIEEQVKLYLKEYYDLRLLQDNNYVDLTFGADIVVFKDGRVQYLHVAKNSRWSKNMIKEKGHRRPYILHNNKKHYWTREWGKAHHLLLFNEVDSDRMQDVNGNVLFDGRYLERYFNELFTERESEEFNEECEIRLFYSWMAKNGILEVVK